MKYGFDEVISAGEQFVITLELVPGRESSGRTIDAIKGISKDAHQDGRISAVSITDNPGGNPALSPDVLGSSILERGMDVIIHFTCRDMNRVGMESRALQLAHMGMKNILALTGDYAGKGYGGKGSPVFDFDSVILSSMFNDLNKRLIKTGHSALFRTGCAVSPFKYNESETFVQYRKLERKLEAGASFTITQLGYDVDKFRELLTYLFRRKLKVPALASLYLLNDRAARAMHAGRVPGVHVSEHLKDRIVREYQNASEGKKCSIERTARLGAVLKGIGYAGIHLGGIHQDFDEVGKILDRMEALEDSWQEFVPEFQEEQAGRFYLYKKSAPVQGQVVEQKKVNFAENMHYLFLRTAHDHFFDKSARFAPLYRKVSDALEKSKRSWVLKRFLEDPFKKVMLSCQSCGDCGIQHVGFLCPESGCPKHTRNGACGGSNNGYCEVEPEKLCVWVRAYRRMQHNGEAEKLLCCEHVPPRLWELKDTSSWINFHLNRDHQKT